MKQMGPRLIRKSNEMIGNQDYFLSGQELKRNAWSNWVAVRGYPCRGDQQTADHANKHTVVIIGRRDELRYKQVQERRVMISDCRSISFVHCLRTLLSPAGVGYAWIWRVARTVYCTSKVATNASRGLQPKLSSPLWSYFDDLDQGICLISVRIIFIILIIKISDVIAIIQQSLGPWLRWEWYILEVEISLTHKSYDLKVWFFLALESHLQIEREEA